MSDNRDDAAQRMVSQGIATGMEDDLGSVLGNSFSMPKPNPKPKAQSPTEPAAEASTSEQTLGEEAPVPGMDKWKDTYEGYVSQWQAESAEAREKARSTRERIERESEERKKSDTSKSAKEKKEREARAKVERDAERLRMELEGGSGASSSTARSNTPAGTKTSVVDGRGVTDADVLAGQAVASSQSKPGVKQTAYDPTTSSEPLPPSMKASNTSTSSPYDPSSPSSFRNIESGTLSRHSATSQAWEEISHSISSAEQASPPTASTDEDDLVKISRPHQGSSSRGGNDRPPQGGGGPPAQPPSLTLSLFTGPSGSLSVPKVLAVLGINLVLPFINGVMLGFGEIFAREVIKVGKVWWRTGGNFWAMFMGRDQPRGFGGAGGVSGVGLRGSGGGF